MLTSVVCFDLITYGPGACDTGSGNLSSDKEVQRGQLDPQRLRSSICRLFASLRATPILCCGLTLSLGRSAREIMQCGSVSLVARTMLPASEMLSGARLTCSALEGFAAVLRGAHLFLFFGTSGFSRGRRRDFLGY